MPAQAPARRREWPGFLILAGLVLAALLIFNLTALGDLTRDRYDVVAVLSEAEGVRVGSRVRVAGIESGRVTDIRILPRGDSVFVAIRLRLRGSTREVVRDDSDVRAARLRVIGEPLIIVEPGSAGASRVDHGDTLWPPPRVSAQRLLEQGRDLPGHVDSLLTAADRVETLAARRSADLDALRDGLDAVSRAVAGLGRFDEGTLGALLDDRAFPGRVARLADRVRELAAAIDEALARYAPAEEEETELTAALDALGRRTEALSVSIESLRVRLDSARGFIPRAAVDRAIEREMEGVRAQIDSLRAEAVSIGLRMLVPW